jgi:hypothetical protein
MSGDERSPVPPDETLKGLADFWFRLVCAGFVSFLLGVVSLVWFGMRAGLDPLLGYGGLGVALVVTVLALAWLDGVRRRAPRRILDFLRGLGLYRSVGGQ